MCVQSPEETQVHPWLFQGVKQQSVPLTTGAICNQIEHSDMAQVENTVYSNKDKNVQQWPEISSGSEAISF